MPVNSSEFKGQLAKQQNSGQYNLPLNWYILVISIYNIEGDETIKALHSPRLKILSILCFKEMLIGFASLIDIYIFTVCLHHASMIFAVVLNIQNAIMCSFEYNFVCGKWLRNALITTASTCRWPISSSLPRWLNQLGIVPSLAAPRSGGFVILGPLSVKELVQM